MKTALVTGSAKRLGKEIATSLANNGWKVIWHHNSTPIDVAGAVSVKADLTDFGQLPKLFEHGKVDLLINSASIYERKKFADSTEDDFDRNINLHVKAPYFLSQYFAKQTENGHIINIVDAFIVKNKTVHFPYLLSKKALWDLTKMLAIELAPNIRVNAILPGAMREYSDNLDPEFKARRKAQIPQGEFATSKEVISAINFLINSELTAQEIYVDAGEHLL